MTQFLKMYLFIYLVCCGFKAFPHLLVSLLSLNNNEIYSSGWFVVWFHTTHDSMDNINNDNNLG